MRIFAPHGGAALLLFALGCGPPPRTVRVDPPQQPHADAVSAAGATEPTAAANPPRTLATGGYFTCALAGDGRVFCWGSCHGCKERRPTVVPDLDDAVEIAAGFSFACALRANGRVTCWGDNISGQLGSQSHEAYDRGDVSGLADARRLAVAPRGACALRATGGVVCWGYVHRGPLIDGDPGKPWQVPELEQVVEVAAGAGYACAKDVYGAVACWSLADRSKPVQRISALDHAVIHGRGDHLCWIDKRDEVACWRLVGDHVMRPDRPPKVIPAEGAPEWVERAGICIRDADGRVRCWDWRGAIVQSSHDRLVPVAGVTDAVEIDVGDRHACARRKDGAIVCWGSNRYGQLGSADDAERGPREVLTGG